MIEKDEIEVTADDTLPPNTWYIRGDWSAEEIERLEKAAEEEGLNVEICRDPRALRD